MPLDANTPELNDYTFVCINSGPSTGRHLYHEDEFYETLIKLQIVANNEELITLYKLYCEGWNQGYDAGY